MSMLNVSAMLSAASDEDGDAYLAARARIENHVAKLAQARRISVSVEVDPGRASSGLVAHQIQLTYGRSTRVMAVDHETFMHEEFFRTLVLQRLQDELEELASVTQAVVAHPLPSIPGHHNALPRRGKGAAR
jgi:hypothetical protein